MSVMDRLDPSGAIKLRADRPFECRTCGERHPVEYHVCPGCGGFSVERRREEVSE